LNINYFKDKFEENNTEEITGKSTEELISISEKIIKYLKGKRDDLIIHDEKGLVFEGREVEHMKDVKVLFNRGYMIRNSFFITALTLGLILKLFYKNRILKILFYGGIIFSFILIIIGSIIIFNFNRAFVIFHEILFTNDLWILDPEKDLLIQMLPSNFFSDLGLIIVKRYVLTTVFMSAIYFLNKKLNKNYNEVTK